MLPFCMKCGASVGGAFCSQCGTAVSAATGGATPTPGTPAGQSSVDAGAIPGGRKTSPIVWVLVVIFGVLLLGGLAAGGLALFVVHKAREAGIDSDLWRRNPAAATARALALANSDIEVVTEDDGAGTVTVRDRSSGKTTTWNLDQARRGRISISAEDEDGKNATVEIGNGATRRLPSWVPSYPGADSKGHFTVTGNGTEGAGGTFAFSTPDPASDVLTFYQERIQSLRMKIQVNASTPQGGVLTAADEEGGRTLNIVVGHGSDGTTVSVTYGAKR